MTRSGNTLWIHVAAARYILADHEPGAPTESLANAATGRRDCGPSAWSECYSLKFGIGPLSQASFANVGQRRTTTKRVHHAVTSGALELIVAEDALNLYLVKSAEPHVKNRIQRIAIRESGPCSRETPSDACRGRRVRAFGIDGEDRLETRL